MKKEIIEDLVTDIMIAENQVSESLRYFDFYSAFLIGLNVGKESGCSYIALNAENPIAISLYKKLGFVKDVYKYICWLYCPK